MLVVAVGSRDMRRFTRVREFRVTLNHGVPQLPAVCEPVRNRRPWDAKGGGEKDERGERGRREGALHGWKTNVPPQAGKGLSHRAGTRRAPMPGTGTLSKERAMGLEPTTSSLGRSQSCRQRVEKYAVPTICRPSRHCESPIWSSRAVLLRSNLVRSARYANRPPHAIPVSALDRWRTRPSGEPRRSSRSPLAMVG